jgi:hypothetical protein
MWFSDHQRADASAKIQMQSIVPPNRKMNTKVKITLDRITV